MSFLRCLIAGIVVFVGCAVVPAVAMDAGNALKRPERTLAAPDALRVLAQPSTAPTCRPASIQAFARAVRHAPVTVTCVRDRERWAELASATTLGFVNTGHPLHIYLGPETSAGLSGAFQEPGLVSFERAVSIQLLLHELAHTMGVRDESQAEQVSFTLLRSTLVRYFGYSRTEAVQLDRLAWNSHLGRPAAYQLRGQRSFTPWPTRASA